MVSSSAVRSAGKFKGWCSSYPNFCTLLSLFRASRAKPNTGFSASPIHLVLQLGQVCQETCPYTRKRSSLLLPKGPLPCVWPCLCVVASLCLSVCLSLCLSVRPSVRPSVRLSVCLSSVSLTRSLCLSLPSSLSRATLKCVSSSAVALVIKPRRC